MEAVISNVYVKTDAHRYIVCVDGGYTTSNIADPENWVQIDAGEGDRYNLCQNNYFDKSIRTESGVYRYKLVDGQPVECTAEEIAAQEAALPKPEVKPSLESRVDTLETTTDDMILMMADIIGG